MRWSPITPFFTYFFVYLNSLTLQRKIVYGRSLTIKIVEHLTIAGYTWLVERWHLTIHCKTLITRQFVGTNILSDFTHWRLYSDWLSLCGKSLFCFDKRLELIRRGITMEGFRTYHEFENNFMRCVNTKSLNARIDWNQ